MQHNSGELRAAWHGIKTMAYINQCETKQPISVNGVDYSDLQNAFNKFFSRFERSQKIIFKLKGSQVPHNYITVSQSNSPVKKLKIRKAAGPDAICGCTLHFCADQFSEVFTKLFQICAKMGQTPSIWKTSTIILSATIVPYIPPLACL